jgi:HK97 gp10 family phage protein
MTDGFTVTLDDTRAQVRFVGMSSKLLAALTKKTTVLRLMIEAKAKGKAPVKTGALRRGIFSDQTATATSVEGRVAESADVKYAKYVEFGTDPHDIVPNKAKALAFVMGGKLTFAKIVHHPGTKGQFYMRNSLREMAPEIVAGYKETVKEAQL